MMLALILIVVIFALICIISLLVGFLYLKDMDDSRKDEYWKHVNRE